MDASAPLYAALRTIPDFPQPGIQFKDITPLLADPTLVRLALDLLAAPYRAHTITKVVAIEARGFLFGSLLADALGAGFIPVRKHGKLPYATLQETYALEYGTDTIEMHTDALDANDHVLIHDDVLATGGTALATTKLVAQTGAFLVGYAFLGELGFLNGSSVLEPHGPVHAVLHL